MTDDKAALLQKIRLGEDSFLEFKEVRFSGQKVTSPHKDGLADELAAFANSQGGVCLLGVNDGKQIEGIPLENLDAAEAFVRQLSMDSIKPPLLLTIARMELPDESGELRPILKLDIPRSLFVHRSPGGYLHRIGSARCEMAPDYLARLTTKQPFYRLVDDSELLLVIPSAAPELD